MGSHHLSVLAANPPPFYALETCSYCAGMGLKEGRPCEACDGRREVLVHQPPLACPRCQGTGKASEHDRVTYYSHLCVVCRGTGWALTRCD